GGRESGRGRGLAAAGGRHRIGVRPGPPGDRAGGGADPPLASLRRTRRRRAKKDVRAASPGRGRGPRLRRPGQRRHSRGAPEKGRAPLRGLAVMRLKTATSGAWLDAVLRDFDSFLQDHANCERKASGSAMNMVSHYPDRKELVSAMIDLAREELQH